MTTEHNAREEYIALCRSHDWGYNYSDDHRAWTRGKAERAELNRLARGNPGLSRIYMEFATANRERRLVNEEAFS